jgi:hypothetical protein
MPLSAVIALPINLVDPMVFLSDTVASQACDTWSSLQGEGEVVKEPMRKMGGEDGLLARCDERPLAEQGKGSFRAPFPACTGRGRP